MKSLKNMLRGEAPLVGLTTQHVTQPWLASIWKRSGCDFVYVEYEHGLFNEAQLADFVLSCRAEGLPVVAKVPESSRTHTAKLRECGVIGIQLPWTETREQIDQLVSYTKFPPLGIRAAAPGYGNNDYDLGMPGEQFIENANRETVVLAHVETRRGVDNISEILSNRHVDVAFLGMYDLSVSFGRPGNFEHADVVAAVERVIAAAQERQKVVGMYVPDAEQARGWISRGVTFFEMQSEVGFIARGSKELVEAFRSIRSV